MEPLDRLNDAEWLRFVQRAAALPDAPEAWVRAAIEQGPRALAGRPGAMLRRLAAVLAFDSWAVPTLAAGTRALPSEVRHLLYRAGACDVDLRVAPAAGRFVLAGQLLGPDATGVVALSADDDAAAPRVASFDRLGEFHFDDLARGRYRLVLRFGQDEIALPPIEVGGREAA